MSTDVENTIFADDDYYRSVVIQARDKRTDCFSCFILLWHLTAYFYSIEKLRQIPKQFLSKYILYEAKAWKKQWYT